MHLQPTIPALAHPDRKPSGPLTARAVRDGFELFILRNPDVELALAPALGAKVVSLKNLRSGREWLWHPAAGLNLFRNQPGDDFSLGTLVGWDECLPTIAPCTWKGRALPDHGEAWTQPWAVDAAAWEAGVLKTSVRLPVSGFQFTRTLSLSGGGGARPSPGAATSACSPALEDSRASVQVALAAPGDGRAPQGAVRSTLTVEYVLENPSAEAQEFVWAAHPLLALRDGDQLDLTDETRAYLQGEPWLESLAFAAGSAGCAKVYAGPLRQGRAGVFNARTGDRLTFEWDPAACDTLGLWLTRGGWNGHHHLALEPAIGADDSLAVAATQSKRCGQMPPHSTKTWRFQIHIES